MDASEDLLALAVLLERAYRLALDVHDPPSTAAGSGQIAAELVDVLDDARVALLRLSPTAGWRNPPYIGRSHPLS